MRNNSRRSNIYRPSILLLGTVFSLQYGPLQAAIAGDSDLAGPIVFAVAFGSFIMFSGKLYFNYIYGIGLLGCLAMYFLLNLMSLSGVGIG